MQEGSRDREKRWMLGVTLKASPCSLPVHLNEPWDTAQRRRRPSAPELSRRWKENRGRFIIHDMARAAGGSLCEGSPCEAQASGETGVGLHAWNPRACEAEAE